MHQFITEKLTVCPYCEIEYDKGATMWADDFDDEQIECECCHRDLLEATI